ncbi:hypothetical protein [Neobacillus endophyticus]|nr:hypothetical protein [Neobacillus endophyticus]
MLAHHKNCMYDHTMNQRDNSIDITHRLGLDQAWLNIDQTPERGVAI